MPKQFLVRRDLRDKIWFKRMKEEENALEFLDTVQTMKPVVRYGRTHARGCCFVILCLANSLHPIIA